MLRLRTRLYLRHDDVNWSSLGEVTGEIHSILEAHLPIKGDAYTIKPYNLKIQHMRGAGGLKLCLETTWAHNLPEPVLIRLVRALSGPKPCAISGSLSGGFICLEATTE